MADGDVPAEEQMNLLNFLEKKETEYMRIQRHKMGVDDFDLLTIIGRGAFGEVILGVSLVCIFVFPKQMLGHLAMFLFR